MGVVDNPLSQRIHRLQAAKGLANRYAKFPYPTILIQRSSEGANLNPTVLPIPSRKTEIHSNEKSHTLKLLTGGRVTIAFAKAPSFLR